MYPACQGIAFEFSGCGGEESTRLKPEEQLLARSLPRLGSGFLGKQEAPGSHRTSTAGPACDWQSVASFVTKATGPVILPQLAETERDAVKAGHLSGAGASHMALVNNGHFAHRRL